MNQASGPQLWAGRQSGEVASITVRMGESIQLDRLLYREDIRASVAHARMLRRIGLLDERDLNAIEGGLRQVRDELAAAALPLRAELEDIHTHVETRLVELIGEAGKRLHTARSRNDQIAVDTHLFVRRRSAELGDLLLELLRALQQQARAQIDVIVPGYTHLQVAQAVRLAHPLLAHFWAFYRNHQRFQRAAWQAGFLPLGAGALAGVNYDSDREFLRGELGFHSIYPNSMDAVASRDHLLDFLYACAATATHASRIAEELILWSSVEFGFCTLPDALTTGSSIMPQKKNPDLAELIRGKSGRLQTNLQNLLTNLKALPLSYNRDLQEDRHPMLDSAEQCELCLLALTAMIQGIRFHPDRMRESLERGFATATDIADALVAEKGLAFRDAHHLVGRLTARAQQLQLGLSAMPPEERAAISPHLAAADFYERACDLAASADKKRSYGGAARSRIIEQLGEAETAIRELGAYRWARPELDQW
ncbi:MAG: argininosuccinate lyase [Leptospirales bacterium]|nr:argininosuccinate lyase [Leptospirales bacterium]